jgi:hypothetical protein
MQIVISNNKCPNLYIRASVTANRIFDAAVYEVSWDSF